MEESNNLNTHRMKESNANQFGFKLVEKL